jgi:ABC-type nitrate/sulfonate/bicarbonate transport system ATPase subunit
MIRLRQVGVAYSSRKGKIEALRSLDLEIGNEFLAIVGPSGCGKSTLLRVLAGLVKPSEGRIEVDNQGEFSYGIVFQDYSLLPWLTAQQNIELSLRLRRRSPVETAGVTERLLFELGLEDVAHNFPHQLSGGMRQRVAVGRAFASSPSILLMDEPFGALDAITRAELQDTLVSLYEAQRRTIVFVTHDVEEALLLSDRVCVLTARPGRVNRVIEVDFARPRHRNLTRQQRFVDLKYHIEDLLREEKNIESVRRRSFGIS